MVKEKVRDLGKKERGRSGEEPFGERGTWEIWENERVVEKRERLGKQRFRE